MIKLSNVAHPVAHAIKHLQLVVYKCTYRHQALLEEFKNAGQNCTGHVYAKQLRQNLSCKPLRTGLCGYKSVFFVELVSGDLKR